MGIDQSRRFHEPSGRTCRKCGREIHGANWWHCKPCQRIIAKSSGIDNVGSIDSAHIEPTRFSELPFLTGPQGSDPNGGHRHDKK